MIYIGTSKYVDYPINKYMHEYKITQISYLFNRRDTYHASISISTFTTKKKYTISLNSYL